MSQALDKIAFLPFALTVDKWRWQVFRGAHHAGAIQRRLVGAARSAIRAFVRRTRASRPTPSIPAPSITSPTTCRICATSSRYVLQFQFYEAACQQAGWEGPLHRCTIYGNREVGERFNRMLEMGASRPWPDALEAFTGTRQMDGSAMVHYFQPLMTWMQEQNQGQQCGW